MVVWTQWYKRLSPNGDSVEAHFLRLAYYKIERQEVHEFRVSLGYMVRLCLKKTKM